MSFVEDSIRSRAPDLQMPLRGLLEADCAAAVLAKSAAACALCASICGG